MRPDRRRAGGPDRARDRSARLRLGVLRPYFRDLLDDEVRARFEARLDRLRGRRHDADVDMPHAADMAAIYRRSGCPRRRHITRRRWRRMPEQVHARRCASVSRWAAHMLAGGLRAAPQVARADLGGGRRGHRGPRRARAAHAGHSGAAASAPSEVPVGRTTLPMRNLMLRLTQPFNISGHPAIIAPVRHDGSRPSVRPAARRPRQSDRSQLRARGGGRSAARIAGGGCARWR